MNRARVYGHTVVAGFVIVALLASAWPGAGHSTESLEGPVTEDPLMVDDEEGVQRTEGFDGIQDESLDGSLAGSGVHRLRSVPGRPPRALATQHAGEIEFECPEPVNGNSVGGTGGSSFTLYGCPLRVYDSVGPAIGGVLSEEDGVTQPVGWLFGNVQLAVWDGDPNQAAFFSLHGNPANDGRKDNSREDLTHTTFTSLNEGLTWQDQPTFQGFPSRAAVGEWASGAIDHEGRVYPVFLWNVPDGMGNYKSLVGLYFGGTPDESGSVSNAYNRGHYVTARQDGNLIETAYGVHVPPVEEDPGSEGVNGTEAEEPGEIGESAVVRNETHRIAMVWFERAGDLDNTTTGMSGWIDAVWGGTQEPEEWGSVDREEGNWTFLARESLIGPCRGMSDPVVWDGRIYVACVVEKGYTARSRARVGEVDLWRIDLDRNRTELVSFTGITGADHVRLTATPDGYFAVVGSRVADEQQVDVQVSMGWHGKSWGRMNTNLGPSLHAMMGEAPLKDAHVTALALTEDEKTLYLVYKEWNEVDAPVLRPELEVPRLRDYKKVVIAMDECSFPLAGAEFHMGELLDSHQYESWDEEPAIFNDRQDGLQTVRLSDGRERVYLAINDYGAVQYAAINPASVTGSVDCDVGAPPPPIPAVAVPTAISTGSGAGTVVGSAVALVSLAMITYLLAVKRRNPFESVAKAE